MVKQLHFGQSQDSLIGIENNNFYLGLTLTSTKCHTPVSTLGRPCLEDWRLGNVYLILAGSISIRSAEPDQ